MTSVRMLCTFAALAALGASAFAVAKGKDDRGIRFDSPGVLDLAERSPPGATRAALPFETLDSATAAAILAAPAIAEDPPQLTFSEDEFGCKEPSRRCVQEHEAKLLAAADGTAKRIDKRLVVAAGAGQPAVFVDWNLPETNTAEGDSEAHVYLGRLSGSGYHRVEVQFGHDAPGDFLINPQSGKIAFVHNGADLVAPAPDGLHLVTYNALNPPLSLRVAALDASGPRLQLTCAARAADERSAAVFMGWKDANTFDLAIESGSDGARRSLPLRFTRAADAWHVATAVPAGLESLGISCRSVP